MKWVRDPILLALLVASLPAVATADILQWTDDAGVAHYTNLKATVPADNRPALQVVVDEAARRQEPAGEAAVQEAPVSAEPAAADPSQAQLLQSLYDHSQRLSAYLEGLERGLDASGGGGVGGGVGINAPIVVSGSSTLPDLYGYGGPYYGYGWPYFYPGVAVFHERSRHFGPLQKGPLAFGKIGDFGHTPPHARVGWER